MPRYPKSKNIFYQMERLIPGGVNSPVRAFGSVGGSPFIVNKGAGAYIYDIDGNRYVDYVMSWGPLLHGHAYQKSVTAVSRAARNGLAFGASTKSELDLCQLVKKRIDWIEMLRLVNSGTEACMTAIRLARAYTKRKIIVKFDGGYHGHSDSFLVKAGSGLATSGIPDSAGVPAEIAELTISLPYNDIKSITQCFQHHGGNIAAVIVEPVAANMGVIPPADGFLETLRQVTSNHGALLIFDEVITGFRVSPGGASNLYGIIPDLVCLGKILGGGLPIGAVGGRAEIMRLLAPLGPVYQAGTLSGNPLSTASGIAMLKSLDKKNYRNLENYATELTESMKEIAARYGIPVVINRVASLFTIFFSSDPVIDFESARKANMKSYATLFRTMLDNGVFIPPSGYEAWFVSTAHKKIHLKQTLSAFEKFASKYA